MVRLFFNHNFSFLSTFYENAKTAVKFFFFFVFFFLQQGIIVFFVLGSYNPQS